MRTLRLAAAVAVEHFRDLAYSAWSLPMPPVGYAIAVFFLGDGSPQRSGAILGGAILVSTLVTGCISFPLGLRSLADEGVSRRISTCPMPRAAFVLAATIADCVISVAGCLLLLGMGLLLGAPVGRAPWAAAIALSVGFSMALGAALFSSGAELMALKSYGNLIFLAMTLASGLFFSLPAPFSVLHSFFPSYHVLSLVAQAAGATAAPDAWTYVVPAAWIVVLAALGAAGERKRGTNA